MDLVQQYVFLTSLNIANFVVNDLGKYAYLKNLLAAILL